MTDDQGKRAVSGWRRVLFEVIFEADTPAGRWFDVLLIVNILASVAVVMLDSVASINDKAGSGLQAAEWFFTILFTVEYGLRLICVGRPVRYAVSFFGIVDLLAIAPTYVSLLLPGTRYLLVVRILRVLRIFRILKLGAFIQEATVLKQALLASRRKILVFLFTVLIMAVILGSLVYLIEGPKHGFTSIPKSVYWSIVTLTTVGYGDISPQTPLGQMLASGIMILGYSIIAVPTGIVTVHLAEKSRRESAFSRQACPQCSQEGHDSDAVHCKYCGAKL
ncbi:MAG: ion transporter [Sedimentisphaerales bacterium]|nr:ion transporter [Sedimentisphaerales bacterium]